MNSLELGNEWSRLLLSASLDITKNQNVEPELDFYWCRIPSIPTNWHRKKRKDTDNYEYIIEAEGNCYITMV